MSLSSGTIVALNGTVAAPTDGESTVVFNVTGTWSATISIQATVDNINWFAISCYVPSSQAVVSTFSVNQAVVVNCAGYEQVQLIATGFTSGTISVAWANSNAGNNSILVYSTAAQAFIANANLRDGVGNNIGSSNGWLDVIEPAANLAVTATGTAGSAVTLTLPSVASQFHCITVIEIVCYTVLARVGTGTPVLVTSTNLPGNLVWDFQSVGAIGASERQFSSFVAPLKSSVNGTATTIVCPATTSVIWRINVAYYAAS